MFYIPNWDLVINNIYLILGGFYYEKTFMLTFCSLFVNLSFRINRLRQ